MLGPGCLTLLSTLEFYKYKPFYLYQSYINFRLTLSVRTYVNPLPLVLEMLNPRLVNAKMKARNAKTENVSSHIERAVPSSGLGPISRVLRNDKPILLNVNHELLFLVPCPLTCTFPLTQLPLPYLLTIRTALLPSSRFSLIANICTLIARTDQ